MTTIGSCDHHGPEGTVPSNRSRARILEQFAAAQAFGDAFWALGLNSDLSLELRYEEDIRAPSGAPTIQVDAMLFLECWAAYHRWYRARPTGDDLTPAPEKPPEIRVPPDEVVGEDTSPSAEGG